MFLDLNPENVIAAHEIAKGNLIGRGAFGFVFKATLNRACEDDAKSVAMKMLQPVQPGLRTGKVIILTILAKSLLTQNMYLSIFFALLIYRAIY